MAFTKITNAELNSRGATTLPNQPAISPQALKEEFDAPAKEVVAPKFNNLIDELEATSAAASIGASAPTGQTGSTIQDVLNSLAEETASIETRIPEDSEEIEDAINKRHTHSNKSLLDSYDQTNTNIADAVTKKHSHGNKSLLDSYTQTETNLANAVSNSHSHSNKSLLDSYTQTEVNLADAVSKKHSHSNKTALDKISENASGRLTYGTDTDGFQPLISQDIQTPSSSGNDADLVFEGSNGTSQKKLWRYENGSWVRTMLGHKITVSTTDIGEGVALDADEIYIVVES